MDFLNACHQLYPAAKRVLLITHGDYASGLPRYGRSRLGQFEEATEQAIGRPRARALSCAFGAAESADAGPRWPQALNRRSRGWSVPQWSARSHQLRDLLTRNSIPHGFYDVATPAGPPAVATSRHRSGDHPIVLLFDGRVLIDPPNERLAEVAWRADQADEQPLRPGGRRRRSRWPHRRHVRGLRRPCHAATRAGSHWRAGRYHILDPQLPWLSAWHQRPGVGIACHGTNDSIMGAEMVFIRSAVRLEARGEDRLLTLIDGNHALSHTVVIATGVTYRQPRCSWS